MQRFVLTPTCELVIAEGDLTKADVDAIVNAANQRMLGGGGVDGAIHRAAGPELRAACAAVPEVRPDVRCPTGEARITPGFRLAARWVIHTVGPVYSRPEKSAPLLRAAYRSSLPQRHATAPGAPSPSFARSPPAAKNADAKPTRARCSDAGPSATSTTAGACSASASARSRKASKASESRCRGRARTR